MDQTSVTIAMPVAGWNVVMKALGDMPFKDVAEIIMSIKSQAEAQLTANAAAPEASE